MTALNVNDLLFEEKLLHIPPLEELVDVLSNGLKSNFDEVTVAVVDAPNLTEAPYHLAGQGLCGSPTILEVGGPPYLLPLVDRSKLYDLVPLCQKILPNAHEILTVGAGAGPHPLINSNCEGILNLKINQDGTVISESHLARVTAGDEQCELQKIPNTETKCALLANLFLSEGKPGQVLRVNCKRRTGADNFITSIRETLAQHYTDKIVGLGGVFLIKNGKAHQHVMRDFSKTPIHTEDELNTWLKFYDMPGTLIALGTLITAEADLDLRLQHFHSFSKSNWGGHYHYDTTPDTIEYEAYFNVGERIVRVDKPAVTHKFGRD